MYRIVSIDPGLSYLGVAVIDDGELVEGKCYTDVGYELSDVVSVAHDIMSFSDEDVETLFVIEVPPPQYYGKGNSVSLLRLFWQILHLQREMLLANCNILYQDAYQWNIGEKGRQRSSKIKMTIFDSLYPTFQTDNNIRTRKLLSHVADAALMGLWVYDSIIN